MVSEVRIVLTCLVSMCFCGVGRVLKRLPRPYSGSFHLHAGTFLSVSAFFFFLSCTPNPQAMGSQGNLSAEVEQATRRQVQGMQSSQQRNRERVLAQLLGMVCDVRPQVHPNYRITV